MTPAESLDNRNPLEPFVLDDHRLLVGDLVLDLAVQTISGRSLQSVKLSRNEFAILETLINNVGRFVSREELLVAVAGADNDVHHSVIDTYISYLHRQLQTARSSATIEKSGDAGFRLCP